MDYVADFLIKLIMLVIGLATTAASAYGIGKNKNNKESSDYVASLTFLCIGLVISTASFAFLHEGNVITSYCKEAIDSIHNKGYKIQTV